VSGTDSGNIPPELLRLLAVARTELDRHLNHNGQCAICQVSFPCERATLADLALSAF
jgi:hypothetical protein